MYNCDEPTEPPADPVPVEPRVESPVETYIPRRLLLLWLGGFALCALSFGVVAVAFQCGIPLLAAGPPALALWVAGQAVVLAEPLRIGTSAAGRAVLLFGSLTLYTILSIVLYAAVYT